MTFLRAWMVRNESPKNCHTPKPAMENIALKRFSKIPKMHVVKTMLANYEVVALLCMCLLYYNNGLHKTLAPSENYPLCRKPMLGQSMKLCREPMLWHFMKLCLGRFKSNCKSLHVITQNCYYSVYLLANH